MALAVELLIWIHRRVIKLPSKVLALVTYRFIGAITLLALNTHLIQISAQQ